MFGASGSWNFESRDHEHTSALGFGFAFSSPGCRAHVPSAHRRYPTYNVEVSRRLFEKSMFNPHCVVREMEQIGTSIASVAFFATLQHPALSRSGHSLPQWHVDQNILGQHYIKIHNSTILLLGCLRLLSTCARSTRI